MELKAKTQVRLPAESKELERSAWNSLEISKLIVGALVPAVLLWYGQKLTSDREKMAKADERYAQVLKKRVELWDKLAGPLNDIYCYYLFVGHWKALSPADVISRKRELDKAVISNRPFFSDEFVTHYDAYMKATFRPFGGWSRDAALRTRALRPRDEGADPEAFTGEDNSAEVHEKYFALLRFAATELDIKIPAAGTVAPRTPQDKQDIDSQRR